jgi:hypothetical protein
MIFGQFFLIPRYPKSSCRQLSNRTPELVLRHALIRLCSLMQLPRVRPQTTPGSRQNPENSWKFRVHPRAPLICKDFPKVRLGQVQAQALKKSRASVQRYLHSFTHTIHNNFPVLENRRISTSIDYAK